MSIYAVTSELPLEPVLSVPTWTNLVERIKREDASAMEVLYKSLSKGIRFLLYRQLGRQDLDDKVHDVFVVVTEAIRNGDLREPERMMGYVHTVVQRQIAGHIGRAVQLRRIQVDVNVTDFVSDKRPDPEREAIDYQNRALAMSVLKTIPKRDREVLTRFYLNEESAEVICRDMDLNTTQFRLIKSRAKARFGELGKRRLRIIPRPPRPLEGPMTSPRPLPIRQLSSNAECLSAVRF
jgi:RNA polymerase sigma factor (sigma-70 family)